MRTKHEVPGAVAGFYHDGEVWVGASGTVSESSPAPVRTTTVFRLGSISKLLTSAVVMRLVEMGQIRLDDSIVDLIPAVQFGSEEWREMITVRRLLSHSSGVDGDYFADFGPGTDALRSYVQACFRLPQISPPGELFSYCNAGYVLLAHLAELGTGSTWTDVSRRLLQEPLDLTSLTAEPDADGASVLAAGHVRRHGRTVELPPSLSLGASLAPSMGLWASIPDLLQFGVAHLPGSGSRRVISDETVAVALEPQVPVLDGSFGRWCALGWSVAVRDGHTVYGLQGDALGHEALLRIVPEQAFVFAAAANSTCGGAPLLLELLSTLMYERLGIVAPEPPAPPLPDRDQAADTSIIYTGAYERFKYQAIVEQGSVDIVLKERDLGQRLPEQVSSLQKLDPTTFVARPSPTAWPRVVFFTHMDQGRATYLHASLRVSRRRDEL